MKGIKVEIQVTVLTIIIAAAVVSSGFFVYDSLSRIIDSIHKEARPDLKLLLIKDIASDLTEVENTVRLYSLTGKESFVQPFRTLSEAVQQKLAELKSYSVPGSDEIGTIDSVSILVSRKLLIWGEIRALHYKKNSTHDSFSELYSKIDTAIIKPDTIILKKEKKKGFFRRLLSKKDTTTPSPIIIDKSREKQIIKQEIADIEQQIAGQSRRLQAKEKALFERNIRITEMLNRQIAALENNEQQRLEVKTVEADHMAAQIYHRLAVFTIAAVILLMIVLILFYRNLQRNRAYQQILKKAKSEAESLAKAKEVFVATVSHEMRTPVNAIYGLTEQLLQKNNSSETAEDLEIIQKSAGHLITLVNDTLDFSKIESQKLKIEQVDFYPEEVFSEVFILHKNAASEKGIKLIVINKADKELALKGDMLRLKQILINLISNALKFTDRGQITLVAECPESDDGIYLLNIEVSDTGIGISKVDQEKIFDEFVQLNPGSERKYRGTGLGLAIVKKLIDIQGGTITVDSIPGKGSRFSLQIPYQKGDTGNIRKKMYGQLVIPERFRKFHFLLVDDEEFNLHFLKKILKKWGVSYTEAFNGQEAVKLALENSYDLILMDVRMPVMGGFEATRQIMKIRPGAKIIALTATDKNEDRRESVRSGMKGLLQKPFSESDFLKVVLKLLPGDVNEGMAIKTGNLFPVNLEEMERMAEGNKEFITEMLEIFIKTSEKGLASIFDNFQSENWDALADSAHKLAAPAKHMMASVLYDKLKALEKEAENTKNTNKMSRLIEQIEQEMKNINTFLRQKLLEKESDK